MLYTGHSSNERLQRRNIGTLPGCAGTMLEIVKAQLESELARHTKRCTKSFYDSIKKINKTNHRWRPLAERIGIIPQGADKTKILCAFIALCSLVLSSILYVKVQRGEELLGVEEEQVCTLLRKCDCVPVSLMIQQFFHSSTSSCRLKHLSLLTGMLSQSLSKISVTSAVLSSCPDLVTLPQKAIGLLCL